MLIMNSNCVPKARLLPLKIVVNVEKDCDISVKNNFCYNSIISLLFIIYRYVITCKIMQKRDNQINARKIV